MKYSKTESEKGTIKIHAIKQPNLSFNPLLVEGVGKVDVMFTGKLIDPTSSIGIPNRLIHLIVNGVDIAQGTIDNEGNYSIPYSHLNQGTEDEIFECFARFDGDEGTV